MDFMAVFAVVIGGLLLLGSIGLAIYITANGKDVKTWKPLVWGAVVGAIMMGSHF